MDNEICEFSAFTGVEQIYGLEQSSAISLRCVREDTSKAAEIGSVLQSPVVKIEGF